MNEKSKLPPSARDLSDSMDRASARAFNKRFKRPYDRMLEEPEGKPDPNHLLLPPDKNYRQFLDELMQETSSRDDRARKDGVAVVAAAEATLAMHNAPENPGGEVHVTDQWVDGTPAHLDSTTVNEIHERSQAIPDHSGEVSRQDVA